MRQWGTAPADSIPGQPEADPDVSFFRVSQGARFRMGVPGSAGDRFQELKDQAVRVDADRPFRGP